jgi:hypothetical protein
MMETITIDEHNISLLNQVVEFDEEGLLSWVGDTFTMERVAVLEDGRVLALGLLRVIEEYKIILDPKLKNTKKAAIIKELMEESTVRSRCNETIVFITRGGDHYVRLLKKHFGFTDREGIALVKEV